MGTFGPDFILKDSEFQTAASECMSFSEALESSLEKYDEILGNVLTCGVSSGKVNEAVTVFRGYVIELKDMASGIGDRISSLISSFIRDVESADRYLYDAGVSSSARDFSEAEYAKLREFLTSHGWYYFYGESPVWDFITKKAVELLSIIPGVDSYFQGCRRLLLDQHNATFRELNEMFEEVYALDVQYGRESSGYLVTTVSAMKKVHEAIKEMNALISSGGSFTPKNIHSRLGPLYKELSALYQEVLEIKTSSSMPGTAEIASFTNSQWADDYFSDCNQVTIDFSSSIDWMDFAGIAVFQFDELTKSWLFHGDAINYDTKTYLASVMNKMAATELYSNSDLHEDVEDWNKVLKYISQLGKDEYEELEEMIKAGKAVKINGRTLSMAEIWKIKLFMGIDSAGKILKYGDKAIDFLARYLADYTQGLEILESLERNYEGNDEFTMAIGEIKGQYNRKFGSWLIEAVEEGGELGFDELIKKLGKTKYCKTFFMEYEATNVAVETYGSASGLGNRAKGAYDFTIYQGLYQTSLSAYQTSMKKLRDAEPGSEGYDVLAADAKNCFELCKANAVKMFESMETCVMSNKKAYYRYCQQQVKNASMYDTQPLQILSYDEYLAAAS